MTNPTPPPALPAAAIAWQIGTANTPDGTYCVLKLATAGGLATIQIALNPADTDRLAQQLKDTAAQARTGLVLPTGADLHRLNGNG